MRAFSILSLAVLTLAAPEAAALNTPCGSLIGTSEIAIDLSGATAVLRIHDGTGALVVPDSVFGRRVAVLHDGPLGAGATVIAFDAASLPAGVYVVQIRVARSTGAAWTAVRRVTIAR